MIISGLVIPKLVQGTIIIVSAVSVAVADVFLKKAALQGDFSGVVLINWQ